MAWIAVGVQITHRHRLDAGTLQFGDRGIERDAIEWRLDAAIGAHAFRHTEAQCSRHKLFRRRHAQIVTVVLQALAHFDDVAMAFGRQQPDLGTLVLKQSIGGDRGAMDDTLGLAQQAAARQLQHVRQPIKAGHHADRGILRRGRDFYQCGAAGVVHRDKVGERAADIDADLQHGSVSSVMAGLVPPIRCGIGAATDTRDKPGYDGLMIDGLMV